MTTRKLLYVLAALALGATLLSAQSDPLVIAPPTLPDAETAVAYPALTLTTSGGWGTATTWTFVAGQLPLGMTFSAAGTIAGTPTTAGTYSFVIQAFQPDPNILYPATAVQAFSITVTQHLAIATASLPVGRVGVAYSQALTAVGASSVKNLTWSIYAGELPAGITLTADGILAGSPTLSGSYPLLIQVVDRGATTESTTVTKLLTLVVAVPATPITIITSTVLKAGMLGDPYSQPIAATGGVPPFTWQVDSGALPGGLSIDPTTGLISGTPAAAGSYSFQLSASDTAGGKRSATFTLVIAPALSISSAPVLPNAASGTLYSTVLAASGGVPPYAWSVPPQTGSLPPGLVLDPSTGRLSGTPTANGTYQFLVGVSDAAGHNSSKLLTLNVAVPLTITSASPLTNGVVGTVYQQKFAASGGTPPYTWSIAAGALPAGIALDPATGAISGTPTSGGPFGFTVGVKDSAQSVTKAIRLTIGVPQLPALTITGLPDSAIPATQPALVIGLGSAYSLDLTGQAALTFTPDSASDDPAVQFTAGGRSVDFQIPAGTTQAIFGTSTLGIQTGTVAGTITVTLRIIAAGTDVTPTPAPTKVLRIAAAAPVITSARLVNTSGGFSLEVVGYSTTREVTGASVHLIAATGTKLASSDFNIPLTGVFPTWYQDPASVPFGSQFTLTIPFAVQKVANAIGSLTVTLTNTQGTSTAASATF